MHVRLQVGEDRHRLELDQRFQRVLGLHHGRIHALEKERHLILEQPSKDIEVGVWVWSSRVN
jgi:hypothetical protein